MGHTKVHDVGELWSILIHHYIYLFNYNDHEQGGLVIYPQQFGDAETPLPPFLLQQR